MQESGILRELLLRAPKLNPKRPPPPSIAPGDTGPKPLMISLIDLNADHCRWPFGDVGEDDFGFCGHANDGLSQYCSHHHAVKFGGFGRPRG